MHDGVETVLGHFGPDLAVQSDTVSFDDGLAYEDPVFLLYGLEAQEVRLSRVNGQCERNDALVSSPQAVIDQVVGDPAAGLTDPDNSYPHGSPPATLEDSYVPNGAV
jgi:hypothetical protein